MSYQELRDRNLKFVEYIRSLQSWKVLLKNFFVRNRAVVYSDGLFYLGRIFSFVSGKRKMGAKELDKERLCAGLSPNDCFEILAATRYLVTLYDDVWAIRINKLSLKLIGVKVAFIPAALERNFHTVLGCKLANIPIVGILHGVASRHYNVYEFNPGFNGKLSMSVDKYGVWSEWWKEYFTNYSDAYKTEQIEVSGPMRPIEDVAEIKVPFSDSRLIKVLFISEEVAVPEEIVPYLDALFEDSDISLSIKFRPYVDSSERWLMENRSNIINSDKIKIVRGNIQDAVKENDVVVGAYSTAVLEALIQLKNPVYFNTGKWGDYYDLRSYNQEQSFFANDPADLKEKIKKASSISEATLKELRERYFGDPRLNGSKWVVDQMEDFLKSRNS